MSRKSNALPNPASRTGTLFHTVAGGLATAAILALLHHVHLVWTH